MEKSLKELYKLVKLTREKCPWFKEQTVESMKDCLIGEVQELKVAIEKKDYENLKEELGDVFWDVFSIIALLEEQNKLNPKEVIEGMNEKIKRRKPWIFGNVKVESSEEAVALWDKIKEKEKLEK